MIKKLLFILLVILPVYGQYYVKPTASGSGNGSSWANADDWDDDFSAGVSAGDTIYMDGGTDSLVYNGKDMWESGSAGNYIYFISGKYSPDPTNHSGEVIITNSGGAGLANSSYDYLYFKGISIKRCSSHGTYFYGGSNYIVFDSLRVEDNYGIGFWSEESQYHDIKNSIVISRADYGAQDNDNILYQKNSAHIFIHHNYLYQRNQQDDGNHIDNIQFSNYANSVFIYNNICIVDSGVQGHNFILGCTSDNYEYEDTVLIFNNYLYNGGYGSGTGYDFYSDNIYNREAEGSHPYNPFAVTINNTLVSANCGIFTTRDGGRTAFASNNIMLKLGQNGLVPPTNSQVHMALSGEPIDSFKTNLFYQVWDGGMSYSNGGGGLDWSDWTTAGGDGVNDNPDMTNDLTYYDTSLNPQPFEIDATSPAIGEGTDMRYILQAFTYLPDFDYTTDITGKTINWSAPDIGCYQYEAAGWSPPDTTGTVTFTPVTNANLNSYHIAYGVVSGLDSTSHVWTAASDSFAVSHPYNFGLTMQAVENGDTIAISNVGSGSYLTETLSYVVLSGTSRSFSVTTKADAAIIRKVLPGNL